MIPIISPSPRLPALFVGHGNPMNAIEDNAYARSWRELGDQLPRPSAILCISAHWMTRGTTLVHVGHRPRTIHDFYGFPPELYAQQYRVPGAPGAAQEVIDLVRATHVSPDSDWGLDHGAWSVLIRMFPGEDIPVFQLSLDLSRKPAEHLAVARELRPLRERGVLIVGSGNLVHNLGALNPGGAPYDWAEGFDRRIAGYIETRNGAGAAAALDGSRDARMAHPTIEHFLPALYALGVADDKDQVSTFNATFDLGSISMRSFLYS